MTSVNLPRIYLDANVWLAYMLDENRGGRGKTAEFYMCEIDERRATGVASSLTVMEVIDVLRKRIPESYEHPTSDPSMKSAVEGKVDAVTKRFIDIITTYAKQGKLILQDPSILLTEYMSKIVEDRKAIKPIVEMPIMDICPKCRSKGPPKYRPKTVGQYDSQHAMNAALLGATKYVTFDQPIKALGSVPRFKNIEFEVS